MDKYIISQIFVILAYIIAGYALAQKEKIKLLEYISIYNLFMLIQYCFLGGIMGAISAIINIIRNIIIIYNLKKKKKNSWIVFIILAGITIALTIIFYNSIFDIIPLILSLLSLYVFWSSNVEIIRVCNFFISICYIVYSIPLKSYITIVCEAYLIVTILRNMIKRKN